jgi:hypothetical protein
MAEFVTSREDLATLRSDRLPPEEWWNVWKRRLWPYRELMIGDRLYWYDSSARSILSRSRVIGVQRFPYQTKAELFDRLNEFLDNVDTTDPYTASKPDKGYCLAFKVRQEAPLNVRKPKDRNFPREGWLRLTESERAAWFGRPKIERPPESETTLDSYVDEGDLLSRLRALDSAMQEVSPERRDKLVSVSIRNDSKIVKALKAAADYRCQFPACDAQIKKSDGTLYVEVAHIRPVAKRGKSILGNLLVLCPNHHKEFDHGQLEIAEQTLSELVGHLNGRSFTIRILK